MTYIKKPIQVEAFQFGLDSFPEWAIQSDKFFAFDHHAEVITPNGTTRASVGDYIIKGVEGELYPCTPSIFNKTYELI